MIFFSVGEFIIKAFICCHYLVEALKKDRLWNSGTSFLLRQYALRENMVLLVVGEENHPLQSWSKIF